MIFRTISRILPQLFSKSFNILIKPVAQFSTYDKFQQFREVLDYEIKEEVKNIEDFTSYQSKFRERGWTIKQEDVLVYLCKQTEEHNIKVISEIKTPIQFGESDKNEEYNLNQIQVYITKKNGNKTMAVHTAITSIYQIKAANFFQSYEQAFENRLKFNTSGHYTGPPAQQLKDSLFTSINTILEEFGVDHYLLKQLTDYCIASEQNFYIQWLRDLKNTL